MLIDLPTFTLIHVLLSVIGIAAGLVVVGGMMAGVRLDGWTGIYLATTILTNATGFFFPFRILMPSHIVGGLSLVILPIAVAALYWNELAGVWRGAFITAKEPPFAVTQLVVLIMFVALGRAAWRGFRRG